VSLVYRVSGAVRFWNGGAGVPGVLLSLERDRGDTVTGAAGNYTLTPGKSGGVNSISAYDASLALQHDAGLITPSGQRATAADVNKSGVITSMDAFYILQKAADLIALPFPAPVPCGLRSAQPLLRASEQRSERPGLHAVLLGMCL